MYTARRWLGLWLVTLAQGTAAAGDLDLDGADDLLAVNEPAVTAGAGTLAVTLNRSGPPDPCAADVDRSGRVDVTGLLMVLEKLGQPGGRADLNGDGSVNALPPSWGDCP